jgi:4'-phosphopantetheinyl transferase
MNHGLLDSATLGADPWSADARTLRPREVDLWRVDLDAASPDALRQLRSTLSSDEESRAQRFCFERDRWRFVVARGMLRQLVASYLDCAPTDVFFRYGANGKPELAFPAAPIHFNVSHSERLAVYAFTREAPVGIDVEKIRDLPDWASIAATCFRHNEVEAMHHQPELVRRLEFFRAWTRQEALLKAAGVGLAGATALAGGAGDTFPSYRLQPIDVGEEYAATLAAPFVVERANCRRVDLADSARRTDPQTFNLNQPNLSRSVRL